MTRTLNEQEAFWKGDFGAGYMQRNAEFDMRVAERGWRTMLAKTSGVRSMLECGSNLGRNLMAIRRIDPSIRLGLIEINPQAYAKAVESVKPETHFNGPILDAPFADSSFDLTFICGVLIHIAPQDLEANIGRMVRASSKYVLICEYFSRTPSEVVYHGQANKLFKRDFGKFALEHFPLKVVDYGFLWSQEYEAGGFDDMTWWLFEKKDLA